MNENKALRIDVAATELRPIICNRGVLGRGFQNGQGRWREMGGWMFCLISDMRFGFRMPAKRPGFTLASVLTLALGAEPRQILKMVLRQGMLIVVIRSVLGLISAAAAGRLTADFLVGYIPARRATKVDPMVALRYE